MQDCCSSSEKLSRPVCQKTGATCGKPVGRETVEALIKPEHKNSLPPTQYYFCDSPECDIVYVSESGNEFITKDQLSVRVGIKEKDDPIPLCYCFDFDRKEIWDDIRRTGKTDIPKLITRRVKAGECRCQVTNPRGSCCLGDIYRAVLCFDE